jgi:hypothetical protein
MSSTRLCCSGSDKLRVRTHITTGKIYIPAMEEISAIQEVGEGVRVGEKKLFLIIVSVLGHVKR